MPQFLRSRNLNRHDPLGIARSAPVNTRIVLGGWNKWRHRIHVGGEDDCRLWVARQSREYVKAVALDWHFAHLPLVVGSGAATRAREFLALLDAHPEIREQVRASVLVAERRWNLKLKNGLDVRLPEADVPRALDTLAELDRDRHLISRDITAIDLRLPDRVSVHLSDEAAQAREDALKDKTAKRKGGNA